MATRIVVLSDGTGNTPNKVWRSNVWRIFQYIDRLHADQLVMYDDGVGTSSFLPLALFGGMFGWGLKRNVINLYKFICHNYKTDEDQIFAFGFSRGAFTIDVLIGLIANQGLAAFDTEEELSWKAAVAYRAYRRERSQSRLHIEAAIDAFRAGINLLRGLVTRTYTYNRLENRHVKRIRFVGLWDTVGAYGLPLEGMTLALSRWFWPLDLPNRELSPIVQRACHALALDDERITFHPILWNERGQKHAKADAEGRRYIADERISQVWFSGSHANVGGGYPDDSLSYVSLCWMLQEAAACGLVFNCRPEADPDALAHAQTSRDRDGRIYDSRRGIHGFYRYGPRNLTDLCHMRFSQKSEEEVRIAVPKIHESVFQRIQRGARSYAPLGIPSYYEVVTENGQILKFGEHPYETLERARARSRAQVRVWNLVWWRKLIAYISGATWLLALSFPIWIGAYSDGDELTGLGWLVSTLIRVVGALIPYHTFDDWINIYAYHPTPTAVIVFVLGICHYLGRRVKVAIADTMQSIWTQAQVPQDSRLTWHDSVLYKFRTHRYTQRSVLLAEGASANFFAGAFVLFGCLGFIGIMNSILVTIQDAGGMVCDEDSVTSDRDRRRKLLRLNVEETKDLPDFKTREVCYRTGVWLDRDEMYSIRLEKTESFKDEKIEIKDSNGFYSLTAPSAIDKVVYVLLSPLKRHVFYPWFKVIARIGGTGGTVYIPLEPDPSEENAIETKVRASPKGELFLYVNDAAIGLPGLYGHFYTDNKGEAKVKIRRLQ